MLTKKENIVIKAALPWGFQTFGRRLQPATNIGPVGVTEYDLKNGIWPKNPFLSAHHITWDAISQTQDLDNLRGPALWEYAAKVWGSISGGTAFGMNFFTSNS